METERAEFSVRVKRAAVVLSAGALLKDRLLFRSYIISIRKVWIACVQQAVGLLVKLAMNSEAHHDGPKGSEKP
jgi:hypothetical protein